MPETIYPGAEWVPGRNAGYNSGRSNMAAAVCHYTVGRDSSAIGRDGYFHWLIARDGHIQQYAEADAVTWHCGEANYVGPGIEIEFLDEPEGVFTDAARDACAGLIHWIHEQYGIPLEMYDGPRIPPEAMITFVTHRSIQQSEGHSDYWPQADWDRMVAGATPAPPTTEGDRMNPELMADRDGVVYVYDANAHTKTRVDGPATLDAIVAVWSLHGVRTTIADSDAARDLLKGAVELSS
jgi:hypothetical protein